jgi:hypothetical protein
MLPLWQAYVAILGRETSRTVLEDVGKDRKPLARITIRGQGRKPNS